MGSCRQQISSPLKRDRLKVGFPPNRLIFLLATQIFFCRDHLLASWGRAEDLRYHVFDRLENDLRDQVSTRQSDFRWLGLQEPGDIQGSRVRV